MSSIPVCDGASIDFTRLFINNQWTEGEHGASLPVVNPATGKRFCDVQRGGASDANAAAQAAHDAYFGDDAPWRDTTGKERAVYLRRIAALITERKGKISKLEAFNCGKPLPEAEWDLDDVAGAFEFYAELAEQLDDRQGTEVKVPMEEFTTKLYYESVGAIAIIVPWNYPLLMATWKVAPALAAGCTMVLKPSEWTSLTALELADIVREAGVPPGVFNVVCGYGHDVGETLTKHKLIDFVAFTGSSAVGTRIMQSASDRIASVSLELGGKSSIIVFDDFDVEKAVEWVMFGVFWTNGQICSSTSRLLVHENIAPRLLARLKEESEKIVVGPPLEPTTKMGPLVNQNQYNKVMEMIESGKREGATVLTGGGRATNAPDGGYYVLPTVFTDVTTSMRIWNEEIFGPVLSVRTFSTEAEAVQAANDTDYGLGGAVLSDSKERRERIARKLRSGIVWINCSQPCFCNAPWGGFKRSGLGRDLGQYGLDRFLEVKQVTEYVSANPWGWFIPSKM